MWKPGATAVPTRCLFWVATLALLGGMFLGSGDAQPEKPALKDPAGTRKLLGAKEIPKGPEATIPNLTEGFPLGVRTFAERYALEHGVVLRGEDAVKYLLDGLRRAAVPNGVEHAADRAPPEAIIVANALLRPALLVCNDRINEEVPNRWFGELNPRQANLQRTLKSVGLIACENLPGVAEVGTGFVVAPNVIMTNRHVAELFSTSDGKFKKHPATGKAARVTINFSVDYCTNAPRVFEIARVIHVEPEPGPDVALLEVPGLEGGGFPTLTLADAPPEPLFDRTVYVAGYPFEDWRNPWEAQRQVFGTVFGVKRLAPGVVKRPPANVTGEEQGKRFLFHDCSTLGGNSGSPLVDLQTGKVLGIHFAGEFEKTNWAWSAWQLRQVPAVKKVLASIPPPLSEPAEKGALLPPSGSGGPALPARTSSAMDRGPSLAPPSAPAGSSPSAPSAKPALPELRVAPSEVRNLLEKPGSAQPGFEGGTPALREGVPEWTGMAAKEYVLVRTGKQLPEAEALHHVLNDEPPLDLGTFGKDIGPLGGPLGSTDIGVGGGGFNVGSQNAIVVKDALGSPLPGNSSFIFSSLGSPLPGNSSFIFSRWCSVRYDALRAAISRPMLATDPSLVLADKAPPDWYDDLNAQRTKIKGVLTSVGCICSDHVDGAEDGTGFVVATNLIMTNRHVAQSFATPDGKGSWQVKKANRPEGGVFIDFARYYSLPPADRYRITGVRYLEPETGPDVALLEVDKLDLRQHPPLKLARAQPAKLAKHRVYVLGYPQEDATYREEDLRPVLGAFTNLLGVKRLSPGELVEMNDGILYHDCSTLGGSSGSPVIDLESQEVLGVHYCGIPHVVFRGGGDLLLYQKACGARKEDVNYSVPSWTILQLAKVRALLP